METSKPRGFAAMTPEERRAFARMGGKRAAELGHGHRFTSETGRAAGRKGGNARKTSAPKEPTP